MTSFDQIINQAKARRAEKIAEIAATPEALRIQQIKNRCLEQNRDPYPQEATEVTLAGQRLAPLTHAVATIDAEIASYEREKADDAETTRKQSTITPTNPGTGRADTSTTELRGSDAAVLSRSRGPETKWVRSNDGEPAALERGQSWADHPTVKAAAQRASQQEAAVIGMHGGLGNLVRSMSTSSGSAVVPTVWASDIIDRARNFAAVLQAGATIVPMSAKVVQVGRLTVDPTAAFRTEGSTVTASDPTFDNVTLTATTQSALVVGSMEWFQDAANVDEVVTNAIAKAIGLNLDLAALYGGIVAGAGTINLATPPNPRGVLAALNAVAPGQVLGAAANGTAQTALSYWNELLDTIFQVKDQNESPNALIWNSKAARQYAKAYDSQGRILARPADLDALEIYTSNQIPSYTQGTMTSRATDLFVGNWSELLIGQRLEMSVQVLTERYAELGQIGIIAHWRGDIQPARPKAFAVYKCIQGA